MASLFCQSAVQSSSTLLATKEGVVTCVRYPRAEMKLLTIGVSSWKDISSVMTEWKQKRNYINLSLLKQPAVKEILWLEIIKFIIFRQFRCLRVIWFNGIFFFFISITNVDLVVLGNAGDITFPIRHYHSWAFQYNCMCALHQSNKA